MAQPAAELRVYDHAQPHDSFAQMGRELWESRELVWRFLVRDISARYRQSLLGWAWAILPAIATTLVFSWLRSQRVFAMGDVAIPYPAYVLLGMVSWQIFQGGLSAAAQSLTQAGNLVAKVRFPHESLVLAAIGGALFDAAVRAVLVGIVFAAYGIVPAPTAALLPLVWLPLLLLVAGLGLGLALANGLVRDVSNALSVALGLFFFLVPVVIAAPAGWLTDLNPVASIIVAAHDLVVVGHLTRPFAFAGACAVSLAVLPAGWWTFRAAESLVAERI
jgi:lipopolysaccharide transport system permease protein